MTILQTGRSDATNLEAGAEVGDADRQHRAIILHRALDNEIALDLSHVQYIQHCVAADTKVAATVEAGGQITFQRHDVQTAQAGLTGHGTAAAPIVGQHQGAINIGQRDRHTADRHANAGIIRSDFPPLFFLVAAHGEKAI